MDFYVDSSVVLRALSGSPAALAWFNSLRDTGKMLVASRIGELEVKRVAANMGITDDAVADYTSRFAYMPVDDHLIDEALALKAKLKLADAMHLAAARRLGPEAVIIVTHDAQLATAAQTLGFQVLDPVTDDPKRAPVA